MNNSKNASKAVGAVALGVLAGTALGVLFAPHKGSKTRKKIAGNAKKMAKEAQQKVMNQVEALKNKALKLEQKAEDKLTEFKNSLEDTAQDFAQNK